MRLERSGLKAGLVVLLLAALAAEVAAAGPGRRNRGDRADKPRKGNDAAPAVGDPAPDFSLKPLRGEGEVKLSSFTGQRPVVLIFGSYT